MNKKQTEFGFITNLDEYDDVTIFQKVKLTFPQLAFSINHDNFNTVTL